MERHIYLISAGAWIDIVMDNKKKLNRHKLQIKCQHKRGEQTATTLSSDAEKLFTLMRFGILSN